MTDRLSELRGRTFSDLGYDDAEVASSVDLENQVDAALDEEARKGLEKFEREANAINQAIRKIEETIESIEHTYLQTLDEHVSKKDNQRYHEEIEEHLQANEKRSGAIRKRLKRIGEENKAFAVANKGKNAEIRIRASQHQNMVRTFMAAMESFEKTLDRHRGNVKKTMFNRLQKINPQASKAALNDAVQTGDLSKVVDNSQAMSQLQEEDQQRLLNNIQDLRSRNNDIKKLENNILELHQLFVDMQILVDAQGEIINAIEHDVEDTKKGTVAAHQELVQAREHQKSATKKKICIVFLVIAIFLAILIPVLITQIPKWIPDKDKNPSNQGQGSNTPVPNPVLPLERAFEKELT